LAVGPVLQREENCGVPVLVFTDLARPENFHEIAGLRLIKIIEVLAQLQFVEKTGGAWPIRVPPAPDSFAIALIANDQLFQSRIVEMQFVLRAQSLDRSDEHQIRCPRAETWPRRQNEKLAGLKMCRGLEADLCEVRNRITPAFRHLLDLLKNKAVAIAAERGTDK